MSEDGLHLGLFGVLVGYAIWGNEPAYIDILKEQAESDYGEAYALEKVGSGQVAVIHGFVDDADACWKFSKRLEAEGGYYHCIPVSRVAGPRPWWKVW